MVRRRIDNPEEGYTLIEIIIAVMLMSLVVAIGSVIYLFAQKHVVDWRRNINAQNQIHLVNERLAQDMYGMGLLEVIGDSTFTFQKNRKTSSFFMFENVAYKDSIPILSNQADSLLFLFQQQETDNKEKVMIEYRTSIKSGRRTIETRNIIGLRRPALWKPLNQSSGRLGESNE